MVKHFCVKVKHFCHLKQNSDSKKKNVYYYYAAIDYSIQVGCCTLIIKFNEQSGFLSSKKIAGRASGYIILPLCSLWQHCASWLIHLSKDTNVNMAHLFQVDRVRLLCSCGVLKPITAIYLCRHCLKLRCGNCVSHEVSFVSSNSVVSFYTVQYRKMGVFG